jgi:hypothetical protein
MPRVSIEASAEDYVTALNVQFLQNVVDMIFDSRIAQTAGDLLVLQTACDQPGDFSLLSGQPLTLGLGEWLEYKVGWRPGRTAWP